MKAVIIREFGGPEGLALVNLPDPAPGAGQVVIAIQATAVGFQDVMIRRGTLAAYGFKKGHVLGGEVAGLVHAVGEGVDPSWIGRMVWAFVGLEGGYAELVVASASSLVPLPADLLPAQAVALGGAGVVAHFALQHAHFARGESVLVRGAAGPIGIMAVQLASRQGASVVAVTTSSAERGQRLHSLGATHVLNREGEGSEQTSTGFDVILDVVAGADMRLFFKKLNPNGRFIAVGAVGGFPPDDFARDIFPAFQRSLTFGTFSANSVPESDRRTVTADLFAQASRSELQTPVCDMLSLAEAVLAHEKMEAGQVFGRIVLAPS